MESEVNIDDKILKIIKGEFKSISRISSELNEPRNKIQVHISKMWKWGDLVRVMGETTDVGGLPPMKYKTKSIVAKKFQD